MPFKTLLETSKWHKMSLGLNSIICFQICVKYTWGCCKHCKYSLQLKIKVVPRIMTSLMILNEFPRQCEESGIIYKYINPQRGVIAAWSRCDRGVIAVWSRCDRSVLSMVKINWALIDHLSVCWLYTLCILILIKFLNLNLISCYSLFDNRTLLDWCIHSLYTMWYHSSDLYLGKKSERAWTTTYFNW